MTTDERPRNAERPRITLIDVSERLLPELIWKAIEEAEQPDSLVAETAMLRTWLYETVRDERKDPRIMLGIFRQIMQAVSIRYRMGPKSTEQFMAAVTKTIRQMNEDLKDTEV